MKTPLKFNLKAIYMPSSTIVLWLILSLMAATKAYTQSSFASVFGGTDVDYGTSVDATYDGGFITSYSENGVLSLRKTNQVGEAEWSNNYDFIQNSGGSKALFSNIIQTKDSNYVLVGRDPRTTNTSFIIKINQVGDTLWTRSLNLTSFGGTTVFRKVVEDDLGHLVIIGSEENPGFNLICCLPTIIKTDNNGHLLDNWSNGLGPSGFRLQEIFIDNEGNYLMSGDHFIQNSAPSALLIKMDSSGQVIWDINYRNINSAFYGITQAPDSGYVMVGLNWLSNDSTDVFKVANNGDFVFHKRYKISNSGWNGSSISFIDNTYFIAGTVQENNGDIVLAKLNTDFEVIDHTLFGGNASDAMSEMRCFDTIGCVIIGSTTSFGAGESDAYFIKTNTDGKVLTISNRHKSRDISLFPNPFNEKATIKSRTELNQASVKVYDNSGRVVYAKNNVSGSSTSIERGTLAPGFYVANILENNQLIKTIKFSISDL